MLPSHLAPHMTAIANILDKFRSTAKTEREKGTYFEKLIQLYLSNEPKYKDLYQTVYAWEKWREQWIQQGQDDPGADTGIDLVAITHHGEHHAIQAKFWDSSRTLYKGDVDSFFTASGKRPFTYRAIVFSTDKVSSNFKDALVGQTPPVTTISLSDLEQSSLDWEKTYTSLQPHPVLKNKKQLRDYQKTAIHNVKQGLETADRGKLIMACGTGKTFTSLKLAEQTTGPAGNGHGGRVLFLVPSLNLLSQTLTEWTQQASVPLHSYAVCSDSEVGKHRNKQQDDFQLLAHELQYPATTNAKQLAKAFLSRLNDRNSHQHMSVVFSTYHSIDTIAEAQQQHQLPAFDLIICDEAHRTTGASYEGHEESSFVKIHNAQYIAGNKRLYMTATPKIYAVQAKVKAETESIELFSMDNREHFGDYLHTLTFSEAVHSLQVLCDYKVIILSVSEDHISKNLQTLLADADNSLRVDDAAKIVGCWRALAKIDSQQDFQLDPRPMQRAVAFAQVIEPNTGAKTHKVSSKHIAHMFQQVVQQYRQALLEDHPDQAQTIRPLHCQAEHVDGSMGAGEKNAKLDWLRAAPPADTCRILSNVRCLSEGVDVPALDAVMFLTPRNSQVDVVQSVGRVMRKDPSGNKKLGYVILPVVIPAGVSPEEALNDNKTYKVVWEVLQALRSHDDRFDQMINKLDLTGQDTARMEVIAITNTIAKKPGHSAADRQGNKGTNKANTLTAQGSYNLGSASALAAHERQQHYQTAMQFHIGEIERAIIAKVVKKVGNPLYWSEWAADIAKIAQTHISRITAILAIESNRKEIAAFNGFVKELRDDLNDSISKAEAVEMLAQHIITKPVFDALFTDYSFTSNNPVSIAMQNVLQALDAHNLQKESSTLTQFYASVRQRVSGITQVKAKQRIIVELYDKFFKNAFPRLVEKLGIVYTPVEVVDFIIHSVNDALKREFGQTLGDENVHIIDPFTGTGTFITRLLQSGLISKEQLPYKYQNKIHANEIVLLAYYIAAINIEQVYHDVMGGAYQPFNGICLTDTFALYEPGSHEIGSNTLAINHSRRSKQKKLDIQVIIGNPPYSAGQKSENDDNQNIEYKSLDENIRKTYAKHSTATLQKNLYDSYIRAIRWASDRIGESGVIGFVSNASFVDGNSMDGLRYCLAKEFSSIYIFHLRGNARTAGEQRRKEKDSVFGQGTRTPIAISLLVKNPKAKDQGKIYFHDIGDYLSQKEKLDKIDSLKCIASITARNAWQVLVPDEKNNWINQGDSSFEDHISLGEKSKIGNPAIFNNFSLGVVTNRDAWCYNFSKSKVDVNMKSLISFYNHEVDRYKNSCYGLSKDQYSEIGEFINNDPHKISWTRYIKNTLARFIKHEYEASSLTTALYRPFTKQRMYFNRQLNEMVYQIPRIFPEGKLENIVITINARFRTGQLALISNAIPDLHMNGDSQCFPLYLYEPSESGTESPNANLFPQAANPQGKYQRRDGISDAGLQHFQSFYPGESISKQDLFYYIYGLLHSEDYKTRYADNLSKELPRIPRVAKAADFWAFTQAGRTLADLHLNYETIEPYPVQYQGGPLPLHTFKPEDYRVEQMKFAKGNNGERHDKTTVIYNHKITITGIPLEAYEYVVNGKPALEWVMERQSVTTHKDSGIVNDANHWATETMNDPAYPLKLFQRVIRVSLETMKIVRGLPRV